VVGRDQEQPASGLGWAAGKPRLARAAGGWGKVPGVGKWEGSWRRGFGARGVGAWKLGEADKNHTGLSPLGISAICGFVFTSGQVCPKGSMIIGLRIGTYFSHGFGVYSHIFGGI